MNNNKSSYILELPYMYEEDDNRGLINIIESDNYYIMQFSDLYNCSNYFNESVVKIIQTIARKNKLNKKPISITVNKTKYVTHEDYRNKCLDLMGIYPLKFHPINFSEKITEAVDLDIENNTTKNTNRVLQEILGAVTWIANKQNQLIDWAGDKLGNFAQSKFEKHIKNPAVNYTQYNLIPKIKEKVFKNQQQQNTSANNTGSIPSSSPPPIIHSSTPNPSNQNSGNFITRSVKGFIKNQFTNPDSMLRTTVKNSIQPAVNSTVNQVVNYADKQVGNILDKTNLDAKIAGQIGGALANIGRNANPNSTISPDVNASTIEQQYLDLKNKLKTAPPEKRNIMAKLLDKLESFLSYFKSKNSNTNIQPNQSMM